MFKQCNFRGCKTLRSSDIIIKIENIFTILYMYMYKKIRSTIKYIVLNMKRYTNVTKLFKKFISLLSSHELKIP